jgi:hypothetical protein
MIKREENFDFGSAFNAEAAGSIKLLETVYLCV